MAAVEPEREMVRRAAPFGPPAVVLALLAGGAVGGWGVGWSAAIAVGIVFANFVVNGLSLARAARVSLIVYSAVVTGGFVLRLAVIVAIMAVLNRFSFFSPVVFALAVVPSTIVLLAFEMRLLSRGLGSELKLPEDKGAKEVPVQ